MSNMMSQTPLADFLASAGHKPYRELIEHHMRRQSTQQLMDGAMGETSMVPTEWQPHVLEYIDAVNSLIGYDSDFWRTATCRGAYEIVMNAAQQTFPGLDAKTQSETVLFGMFQIVTLNFAYSASTQRSQRKFMGIRKGLFG